MSTRIALGIPSVQCLDASTMIPSHHDTSNAPHDNGQAMHDQGMRDGRPLLDQCADSKFKGPNVTTNDAGGVGQHGKDSNMNIQGLNFKQKGVENDNPPNNRKSFASLFQNSRAPTEASKLSYIPPPEGKVVLKMEEIDSVQTAFGYCLVGYVMGPRPSPYTIRNFVKGWDKDVKFTFKENGWIRFQFASEAVRDKILNGGPYIIFGRQLFLKKLPSCFLFRKEDMEFFPSWIQIFGLPADCWTTQALSRIASVVGKPLHTDLITISKKGATYARILVELDAKKPRVREYSVELPTGIEIMITFKYEFEPKYCDKCGLLGHTFEMCGTTRGRELKKQPIRLNPDQTNIPVHNNTEKPVGVACSGSHGSAAESSGTKSGKDKDLDGEQTYQIHSHLEDACLPNLEEALPDISIDDEALPDIGLEDDGICDEYNNSVQGSDISSPHLEDLDMDSDYRLDFRYAVVTKDKDEWKTVKGKNKNKKKKNIPKKKVEGKSGYDEGMRTFFGGMASMSPCDKLHPNHRDSASKEKHERAIGKLKVDEVRPPDTAFGCP